MPTPVSALIHAATMVTAGVYLLMRSSPLIEYSSTVLLLCLWVGAITTVFSSLIGLFQQDIKKVIAYSTMSQLGMMVIAVGLSSYNIALFHLVNHAFYKALLFLGAGAVIHAVADNQDFRKYGALKQFLPLTYSVMLIASLSLVAFPFMTGFYSKDFILESSYGQFYFSGIAVYFVAVIAAMFTTLYSIKVLYLTFIANPNGPITNYKFAHEGNIYMSLPLIILAIFSVFFGYITKDMFIGLGSSFFSDNSLFIHPLNEILLNTEFAVPIFYKLLPLLLTVSLSILSLVISEYYSSWVIKFKFNYIGYNIFSFFNQRFLIELLYNRYITDLIFKLGGQTTKVLDKGSIELIGAYGLEKGLINMSKNLSKLDTGVVTSYALYILIGLISYIIIPSISTYDNSLLLLIIISVFININKSITSSNNHNTLNSSLLLSSFGTGLTKIITRIFSKITIASLLAGCISVFIITMIKFKLDIPNIPTDFYNVLLTSYSFFVCRLFLWGFIEYLLENFNIKNLNVKDFLDCLHYFFNVLRGVLCGQNKATMGHMDNEELPLSNKNKELPLSKKGMTLQMDNNNNPTASGSNNPTASGSNNPTASGSNDPTASGSITGIHTSMNHYPGKHDVVKDELGNPVESMFTNRVVPSKAEKNTIIAVLGLFKGEDAKPRLLSVFTVAELNWLGRMLYAAAGNQNPSYWTLKNDVLALKGPFGLPDTGLTASEVQHRYVIDGVITKRMLKFLEENKDLNV